MNGELVSKHAKQQSELQIVLTPYRILSRMENLLVPCKGILIAYNWQICVMS